MLDSLTASLAAATEPAGGAATDEIAIATAMAMLATAGMLGLGWGHKSGRFDLLGPIARFFSRISGLAPWAAFPSALAAASLICAVFGMYWDISLHIDVGRDEGPLANPAHYFILIGLFGIFAAGFFACVLPPGREKVSASSIHLPNGWNAPLGGVLICACGAFSLIGFPLDDVWHRLFGQDVTLWGPTHLMLIGGAAMTLIGIAVLLVEARRSDDTIDKPITQLGWLMRWRHIALVGGLLIGLSTFQAEFDFGVPQFRFVFQPLLIMLAAGVALVATRIWLGRGAALGAVAFFLVIRGGLAVIVGPVLGESLPHFPLYVAEALLVEGLALLVNPRTRPLVFGAWAGLLLGTVGLAAEWAWTQVFMPLPWTANLLPEAVLFGFGGAVGGSLIGAWIGARLAAAEGAPRGGVLRWAAVGGAVVIAALVAVALYKPADTDVRAAVTLTEASGPGGGGREVNATVRLDPPNAADGAEWITATAWQGDGLIVDRLTRVGPGVYRTNEPLPVNGNWKALIRLHAGNSLTAVPVFLPNDPAIPAKEVPAPASFERTFVADHTILQREQKQDASAVLGLIAYGVVLAIALGLLALLAWGLHRIGATVPPGPPAGDQPTAAPSKPRQLAKTA